ncbi:hypothetical protein Acr_07g0010410 [Actinidia rufa]|uniref:CCHC-type domain-containing protein n=1 Tax=Actinidia rufa TaxID=165716 RepID=A0A7J0EWI8_9ERIC|nr:hypothetical protein Acr_07g0010410 [Actinidia rufa]
MPPHQARGRARSLTRARGARATHRACENRDEGDDDNHQESVMGGEANAFGGNIWVVGGAPPMVISGAEFMQKVFTAIEQVVRNTVHKMLMPARAADTRAAIREDLNEIRRITHPKSQHEGTSAQPEGHFSKKSKRSMSAEAVTIGGYSYIQCGQIGQVKRPLTYFQCGQIGHIARQCTQRRNTQGALGPQVLGQKNQRTQGRAYAMTSVAGPSGTAGQQKQQ